MSIYKRFRLALAAATMLVPAAAWADPIPGLYNTGLDPAGRLHAGSGGVDAHYRVNGGPAITYYNGAYPVQGDAQWIGQSGDGSYQEGRQTVQYTLTFDLTGYNVATARISGSFAIDNEGTVSLNGGPPVAENLAFTNLTPFVIASGFKEGINTLTFTVTDLGPPSAFVVTGLTGTADRSSPPVWITGGYGDWSASCGDATRSRPVTCVNPDNGATLQDFACAAPKPSATESSYQTAGCGYTWEPSAFSPVTPSCGATTQTRTLSCRRSDGQLVVNDMCAVSTMPSTTQQTNDYSACTHAWTVGAFTDPSTTCGNATQARSVTCLRSDGATAQDAACSATTKPESTQTSYQTSGCGAEWQTGEYAEPAAACGPSVKYRDVWCFRSDGRRVDDGACSAAGTKPVMQEAAPSYATCTFAWTVNDWSAPTATCGAATESRTVTCRRSEGTTVADAQCAETKPDTTRESYQTSGCGYEWRPGAFGAAVPACGATTHSRTVSCIRSDGQTVGDSSCGSDKPASSEATTDYSTCTFAWSTGDWTTPAACGDVTRTRQVTCTRSNGDAAPIGSCDAASRPTDSERVTDTSTCTYDWAQTGTGAWSECTAGVETRTVTVECRRNDGAKASDAACTTARPAVSETRSCATTTPTPTPAPQEGEVVVFRRPLPTAARGK